MESSVRVKVNYHGNYRRTIVSKRCTFVQLHSVLTEMFGLPIDIHLRKIFLKDEEGDLIRVTREEEWYQALLLHDQAEKVLHLSIVDNENLPKLEPVSSKFETMENHYDVIVIGSGYGGSIVASRIARANKRVCLLEKGKELLPGQYPNTAQSFYNNIQLQLPDGSIYGPKNNLYSFSYYPNIIIWRGCGLGGTSLINSNVSIKQLNCEKFLDSNSVVFTLLLLFQTK